MKFSRHIANYATPEWSARYPPYYELKEMLQDLEPTTDDHPAVYGPQDGEQCQSLFFHRCEEELVKVNTILIDQLAATQREFASLLDAICIDEVLTVDKKYHRKARHSDRLTISADFPKEMEAWCRLYASLILLENFQKLNHNAFDKLLKRHDTVTVSDRGAVWRREKLQTSMMYTNTNLHRWITSTEETVVALMERWDRKKQPSHYQSDKSSPTKQLHTRLAGSNFCRLGFFLTTFVGLLVAVAVKGIVTGLPYQHTYTSISSNVTVLTREPVDWRNVLRLYRGPFLVIVMTFLVAVNVVGWKRGNLDLSEIFKLTPPDYVSQYGILEVATCMGILWCTSLLLFLHGDFLGVSQFAVPLVASGIALVFIFNPCHVIHYHGRRRVAKIMRRIITSPVGQDKFAESWLGDQFVSLAQAFQDAGFFICFYAFEVSWDHNRPPGHTAGMCMSNHNVFRPIVAVLPTWFRFAQCLRTYYNSKLAHPNLLNAGKYSTTFFTVIFSYLNSLHAEHYPDDLALERPVFVLWVMCGIVYSLYSVWVDVRIDWALLRLHTAKYTLLRDTTLFSHGWYYYAAITEDVLFRFAWTLSASVGELGLVESEMLLSVLACIELFRRFVWNFFRLEHEHIADCTCSKPLVCSVRYRRKGEAKPPIHAPCKPLTST